MPTTVNECAQEMAKSYNQLIAQGFAAAQEAWGHSTSTTRLLADAAQTEQSSAGKLWEAAAGYTSERSQQMLELIRAGAAGPSANAETQETFNAMIAGDQQFLRSCSEYGLSVEQRRAELVAEMLRANAELATTGQAFVTSAFDCTRAFVDWSLAVTRGAAPTAPF